MSHKDNKLDYEKIYIDMFDCDTINIDNISYKYIYQYLKDNYCIIFNFSFFNENKYIIHKKIKIKNYPNVIKNYIKKFTNDLYQSNIKLLFFIKNNNLYYSLSNTKNYEDIKSIIQNKDSIFLLKWIINHNHNKQCFITNKYQLK